MNSTRKKTIAGIRTVLVGILAVFFILPLVWMICTSLKTIPEVFARDWKWLFPSGEIIHMYGQTNMHLWAEAF